MISPKKMVLETLFTRILREHCEWLFLKGYTEDQLGTTNTKDSLSGRLKAEMTRVGSLRLWDYAVEPFDLAVQGDYGRKKEAITYTFHYTYDATVVRFNLEKMTAVMDDQALSFPIWRNTRHELPASEKVQEMFGLLLLQKQKAEAKDKSEAKEKVPLKLARSAKKSRRS
jgi:hypothetical protein